ncbi:MAG: DUF2914 domain-containing protein [Pseudomonadota bacterium]|nr:DUF2914 domain-containing protein [Pseudomonadota bacterium]
MPRAYLVLFGLAVVLPLKAAEPVPAAAGPVAPVSAGATATTPAHPARVTQAVFTTGIRNHEPVNSISTLTNRHHSVYFFTDLRNMAGQTVVHRWVYQGKIMAEVKFTVGGPRWRVYSRKTLQPGWLGEWQASVVDASGLTLGVSTFEYTAAPRPRPAQQAPQDSPRGPDGSGPSAPKMDQQE